MLNTEEIKEIFIETGVLLEGHFKLSSGLHADKYLQCARVLQYPKYAKQLSKDIASLWEKETIDLVIGPALGGVVLSYTVGQELSTRTIFTERKEGEMRLRRGFNIKPGDNILVVEDVVTTGGSVREVVNLIEKMDGNIIGISSLVDRSDGAVEFNYLFKPLLQLNINSYDPADCPLCEKDIPINKPGSR